MAESNSEGLAQLLSGSRFKVDRGPTLPPVQLEPVTMLLGKDNRGDMTAAVVSLYHRVNPKWGCGRLKRIVKDSKVSTVCLLLPSTDDVIDCEEAAAAEVSDVSIAQMAEMADALDDFDELELNSDPEGKGSDDDDDGKDRFDDEGDSDEDEESTEDSDDDSEVDDEESDEESDDDGDRFAAVEDRFGSRLVACMSFEIATAAIEAREAMAGNCRGGGVQVTLLAVHPRWQRRGIGRQLVQLLQTRRLGGDPMSLLTCAEHGAVGFFSKCSFSDDPLLTARFRKLLSGGWHDHKQTVTMCYEQPEQLTASMKPSERKVYSSLEHIDSQVAAWQQARIQEHSRETALITMMRNEIAQLRQQVVQQDDFCKFTAAENRRLRADLAAKDDVIAKLRAAAGDDGGAEAEEEEEVATPAFSTEGNLQYVSQLESLSPSSREFASIVAEIDASVRESHGLQELKITAIQKPKMPAEASLRFSQRLQAMHDGSLNTRLFFGGSQLDRVLSEGFNEVDMHDSYGLALFGKGLYFSRFFSKAHFHNGGTGQLLLALVGLGKSETVVAEDPTRDRPTKGHDSMCVPGRKVPLTSGSVLVSGSEMGDSMEEYVVFHPAQALPMYLISYTTIEA